MNRTALTLTLILSLQIAPVLAADLTQLDADKIAQYGIASFQKGDYKTALRYLTARARLKPEDANVYYYLGNCYLKASQNDQAAHMFSLCIRVSPGSQAGKYALSALETLSTMPKPAEPVATAADDPAPPDPKQAEATRDTLFTEKPLDKAFNDAAARIKGYRQNLKIRVDRAFARMQDEMQGLSPRSSTYAADLEKLQRETENKVQDMQTKELRLENRMLAPNKIDVRAIPQLPAEKIDDTKTALGALMDYFKADKPFDPFGTDITPELTSKFMNIKDLFGELASYQASARRLAKQIFTQLKSSIENRQDTLDRQLYQVKDNLIHDVVNIKVNYGNVSSRKIMQVTAASFITGAKLPRNDNDQLTPQETDIKQTIERSKKRIQDLEDTYNHEVDVLIAGAKERLGGLVAQTGQMNSQLKKPSGTIQLVPQGTDTYTRNYVNFGERPELSHGSAASTNKVAVPQLKPLHAVAKKMPRAQGKASPSGGTASGDRKSGAQD